MASPEDLLKEGKIGECLGQLKEQIRNDPANAKLRTFLFQVDCVIGDWKGALKQLAVLKDMDPAAMPMVQTYQMAIQCEQVREEIFKGERAPLVMGEPPNWLATLMQSTSLTAQGHMEQACDARDLAFEDAPMISGKVNDDTFEWMADGDQRLGPALEAIVNGNYYWIPYDRIQSVTLEEPTDLRDFIWAPANFKLANEGAAVGLVPVRYPGSAGNEDSKIQLSRMTVWEDHGAEFYTGLGQKVLTTDQGEYSMLDIRSLKFDVEAEAE